MFNVTFVNFLHIFKIILLLSLEIFFRAKNNIRRISDSYGFPTFGLLHVIYTDVFTVNVQVKFSKNVSV